MKTIIPSTLNPKYPVFTFRKTEWEQIHIGKKLKVNKYIQFDTTYFLKRYLPKEEESLDCEWWVMEEFARESSFVHE